MKFSLFEQAKTNLHRYKFIKLSYVPFFLLSFLFVHEPVYSGFNKAQINVNDSSEIAKQESAEPALNYSSDYFLKAEIEHQQLIRNIFAVSFIAVLALLLFTMFFYGSKIKKISTIIILQDGALKSTKDQLIKIIGIFNHISQQVYIADSKGIIEWANTSASTFLNEKYQEDKISLLHKFSIENQEKISRAIQEQNPVNFIDKQYKNGMNWKMIPVKNSKGEFSNMVFIC